MRILFYNWVDYDDPERRGGGVSVYQRNVIEALASEAGFDLFFVSSGIAYDFKSRPYLRALRKAGPARRFEIVNSAVLSPGHSAFGQQATLDDAATVAVFAELLDRHGPFDVVHFNNLEGIPASTLALRRQFPDTRFFFSLHNYFPFCPQVNLWYQEREHCADFASGAKCVDCLPVRLPADGIRRAHQLAGVLVSLGIRPGSAAWNWAYRNARPAKALLMRTLRMLRRPRAARADAVTEASDASETGAEEAVQLSGETDYFRRRRATFVELINANVDAVLAVSGRVAEIAADYGIDRDRLYLSYIGTRHAEIYRDPATVKRAVLDDSGDLVLCYLGYMRRDKGFFFLLDTLEKLPAQYARRIRVVIAAARTQFWSTARLQRLRDRYKDFVHVDGYTHDQLDAILAPVTLGVVPVLWEDNLPQVALEMYCRGIPLLCSDRGGAKELGGCDEFTFRANDAGALTAKIVDALEGRLRADDFWRNGMRPVTVAEHVDQLKVLYRAQRTSPRPQ